MRTANWSGAGEGAGTIEEMSLGSVVGGSGRGSVAGAQWSVSRSD